MRTLMAVVLAAIGLGGCVAVPAPYYPEAGYYPAPAIGVGVYTGPGYYYGRPHRRYRW